jgi:hypothetical protein
MRSAGENDDVVSAPLEMPRQHPPNLPASTRNNDAQRTHSRKTTCGHQKESI